MPSLRLFPVVPDLLARSLPAMSTKRMRLLRLMRLPSAAVLSWNSCKTQFMFVCFFQHIKSWSGSLKHNRNISLTAVPVCTASQSAESKWKHQYSANSPFENEEWHLYLANSPVENERWHLYLLLKVNSDTCWKFVVVPIPNQPTCWKWMKAPVLRQPTCWKWMKAPVLRQPTC